MDSPLLKVSCPECGAGLKTNNPAGFEIGSAIECPKCQTYFAAEPPAEAKPAVAKPVKKAVAAVVDDDDDDDSPVEKKPKKKKGKRNREDGDGPTGYAKYRKSPIRFIILGILLIVMIVLAVLLWQKWENQKKADKEFESTRATAAFRAEG
jgi:DNA-directed RNA polymerase subunit M/transcription elongation factor TFIIS